jgi:NADPH:quinone reductase-like Zn-dependent oxidoreductase
VRRSYRTALWPWCATADASSASSQVPSRRQGAGHRRGCVVQAEGPRLGELLARILSGELPARVHTVMPLDRVADAHRAIGKGGVRGRYVLTP